MRILLFIIGLSYAATVSGQILGTPKTFDFVLSPVSARINALGSTAVTVADSDVALGLMNPALLNKSQEGQIALSHSFLFSGIQHGSLNYGHYLDSLDLAIHSGFQYITYGDFDATNTTGLSEGNFSASEVAVVIGASKQIAERITFGLNLRYMAANYAEYGSNGLGVDAGLLYTNPENTFAIGAVVRNAGIVLSPFTTEKEEIRNDIQLGLSKRLKHLPFRYSITLHNLQQWNLRYADPADVTTDLLGNVEEENIWAVRLDNFFRHIILSGEFLLGAREQIRLRFGYNHLRNRELSVLTFRDLTGFSLGFGMNIKKLKLDYGVSYYHVHGASHQLSLRLNPFTFHKV